MVLTEKDFHEIFVEHSGVLTSPEFAKVATTAKQTRRRLDQLLMERAFVSPQQLLQLLSAYFEVPAIDLKASDIDPAVLKMIPEHFATEHMVIAFAKNEDGYSIAVADPRKKETIESLKNSLPGNLRVYVTTESAIHRALVLYSGSINIIKQISDQLAKATPGTSAGSDHETPQVVSLVNSIIETAVLMGASDVHIEPFETEVIVRLRIDGILRSVASLPPKVHQSLVARYKILSQLKVDQKRLPQDGRFKIDAKGEEVNVRVSSLPSMWGEKLALRILPKETQLFDLGNLGLLDKDLELVKRYLRLPYGMILVCGPTGSGKTTTLYAFLQEIGNEKIDVVNISTIEDPIEYTVARVTQVQIQPEIDLTFAAGLRALLRQDPDIIMVGEIRDKETAQFATRAALVGRLLLSSLHTNDAPGTIPRLLDIGVEPYLISSTVKLVVAQRLARRLCGHCRQSYKPTADVIKELSTYHDFARALKTLAQYGVVSAKGGTASLRFYKSSGCDRCGHTGYQGRISLVEIMEVNEVLQTKINDRIDHSGIRDAALANGMKTMFEDGLAKVLTGVVDIDEVIRVAYD